MKSRSAFLWPVALLAVWLTISPARAAGQTAPPGLVFVTGTVPAPDLTTISDTVQKAVRGAGWELPAKPLARGEAERVLKCVSTQPLNKCFPAGTQIPRVFVVTAKIVTGSDGLPATELTGQAFATGANTPSGLESAIRTQNCENCSATKLETTSNNLVAIVLQDLVLRMRRTFLEVSSTPVGANVTLDGTGVGATNDTFNTYPGEHEVRFDKRGYIPVTRKVTVKENQTVPVAVDLQPENIQVPVRPPAQAPSKLPPLVVIVAGSAVLATGVVWSLYATKGGADEPYEYTRALKVGIPTAVVGLATGVAGVVWYKMRSRSSAPTATVTPQGAVVGWTGRF